ncbi:MAG: glycosyltransferase family 4 protein [Verrucomicrobia bacterium]|nr:glycosyltransferase family 4 protein [Verrucomicrobiota bacterium]
MNARRPQDGPLRIALLATDAREHYRDYARAEPYFGTAPAALLEGLALLGPELEVHVVSCTQRSLPAPPRLADNTWFHSLRVPKRGWMRTGYQGCIRAVRRHLRQLQPQIVHAQGTERDCGICGAFSGFPNVLTIHGNMRSLARLERARPFTFLWLAARLETLCLRRTHGVLCNSQFTQSQVQSLARKTWRVPNPLRTPFFSTPPAGIRRDPPRLLNVGTVLPFKHQLDVLGIARRLHTQGARFDLQFVGALPDTPYGAAFQAALRDAAPAGFARYSGMCDAGSLIRMMDEGAALVHCPEEESFGLVVAEALARNLKLFALRVGGVSDIAEGLAGVELFEPGNWAGLEEALAQWLHAGAPQPPPTAGVMRERYHPRVIALRHLEIYRELASTAV